MGSAWKKKLVWKSCYGTLSVSRKIFAHFNLRKYLAQALVLSKIDYCEYCILPFTRFPVKTLAAITIRSSKLWQGTICAGREDTLRLGWLPMRQRRDFSLLKLVHKALYMNNWPLALRSNQVTSLHTLRSSSATRLSNPHRSSGTIFPVKYPALNSLSNFNCHAKTYLFKQDFNL